MIVIMIIVAVIYFVGLYWFFEFLEWAKESTGNFLIFLGVMLLIILSIWG